MVESSVTRRPLVVVAVMLSMFMVAIEATIVATAMPRIVGQLGGLTLYSWIFSAFLLTQTVATVVFGKLADVLGRKPTLLAGIAVFLAGSLACGLAWSMESLIAFRLIQGLGAGAVQPVAQTVIGDLYSAEERGRIQGFLASVWAFSALVGPVVGALIVEHTSWAWIFWINLPLGALGSILFLRFLHEDARRTRRAIDAGGAALFTLSVGALMIALTEFGHSTATVLGAGAVFVVAGAAFAWRERRAAEPLVSLALWARRPIAAANATGLFAGMALIGLTTFLPMYVQGILGQTPVMAGLALTAMVLGWPIGATAAARNFRRFGLRAVIIAGSVLMPLGAAAFVTLAPGASPVIAGVGSLVMGLGMGLLSSASIVMIQEIVPWSERGSATASNVFARNLGSALGAAVFGAVLNHALATSGGLGPVTSDEIQAVLAGATGGLEPLRAVLQGALHQTFWAVFVVSVAALVAALAVPHVPLGRVAERPA